MLSLEDIWLYEIASLAEEKAKEVAFLIADRCGETSKRTLL